MLVPSVRTGAGEDQVHLLAGFDQEPLVCVEVLVEGAEVEFGGVRREHLGSEAIPDPAGLVLILLLVGLDPGVSEEVPTVCGTDTTTTPWHWRVRDR